jgi:hypothetical protein
MAGSAASVATTAAMIESVRRFTHGSKPETARRPHP